MAKVAAIERVCDAHGVELAAAALQFPLAHPCVSTVVVGMSNAAEVSQNLAWLEAPIPASLWDDLKAEGLLHAEAPTPTSPAAAN